MMTDKTTGYREKAPGYFRTPRLDLLKLVPPNPANRILEIGCGDGVTLATAKQMGLASEIVGLELMDCGATDLAPLDRIFHGDVETLKLPYADGHFDVILCGDVLEHLIDPWSTLQCLARLLRPGGTFIASIPNFRHHSVLRTVYWEGDFRYAGAGLLDRTHLRFFCRKNVHKLFASAGLTVEAMHYNMGAYGKRQKLFDFATLRLFHELFIFQFRAVARKPGV